MHKIYADHVKLRAIRNMSLNTAGTLASPFNRGSLNIGKPKPQRYVALDGLRGIAALIVVLYHIEWPNHLTGSNAIHHGFLFVDLFLCFPDSSWLRHIWKEFDPTSK